jgi:hypothetical protein
MPGTPLILLIAFLLVAACAEDNGEGDAPQPVQPAQEHVWNNQTNAMDKARDVEQVLQEDAARKRRQLEEQED